MQESMEEGELHFFSRSDTFFLWVSFVPISPVWMRVPMFKALQPGLVKGRWTKEEDDIITQSVSSGNDKWSEIAKRLPGRIGEQIKERWINVLDPDVKKGIWTEAEMRILRDSQRELGNKWSEIAKRIPGRNENSVKNRWYNQKTVSGKTLPMRALILYSSCGDPTSSLCTIYLPYSPTRGLIKRTRRNRGMPHRRTKWPAR